MSFGAIVTSVSVAWIAVFGSGASKPATTAEGGAISPASPLIQQVQPSLEELADEVLRLLNDSRADAGLQPLRLDPSLSLLAYRHSQEQANRGRVSHHSYEFGLSSERRVRVAYPQVPRLAENVARNRSVPRLHAALLASEGHRRNRMDPEFTHVGIGLARGRTVGLYLTEIFITADETTPLGSPVAFYFDADPGAYERRENPVVEQGAHTITVGAPGPDDPEHWTNLGIEAYQSGELIEAEQSFRKALELEPDYHYAAYNLARVLISVESVDEAAGLLDALIARDPDDLDAVATRGTAALFLQDYAHAAELFRRVLRVRPRDANNWYNLGLSLEYLDRAGDAEVAYREALDIEPTLTAAAAGLARVMRR